MTILTINWRGTSFYVAKHLFGSKAWQTTLRAIDGARPEDLSKRYLERLLEHATQRVPYYAGLKLQHRRLAEFPILSKQQLRMDPDAFTRTDLVAYPHTRMATSGSTGEAIEVLMDGDADAWREAIDAWYFREMLGTAPRTYTRAQKVFIWHRHTPANLSIAHRLARFAAPIRWLEPYEAFTEEGLLDYVRRINRLRPAYLWSFTGVLYEMASVARRLGIHVYRPRCIIASGETLHPHMRSVIEEVFGCRVYDYYGSTEAGRVAAECDAGNLHVFTFAVHAEVLDPSGSPVPPGGQGRLILTPLHNHAMPLIRYDTQDVAEAGPADCPCGCQLPTLGRVLGRTVEFFITPEGGLVSGGRIGRLMRHCPWVLGFQILQQEIDRIAIFFSCIPSTEPAAADIERVNREIEEVFGPACRVCWHEVDEIPQTPNGKRPYARSLVWEDRQPMAFWEPESESTPPDPDASPPSTLAGS